MKLVGRHCSRDAANARVTVHCQGAPRQTRELFVGSSYLSGHTKTLHFGLGPANRAVSVEVAWPCGRNQRITNPPADRMTVIVEQQDKT